MFSGIVEAQGRVVSCSSVGSNDGGLLRIAVERPEAFSDLKTGDSMCTSGVCLTVENLQDGHIQFALGAETLKLTGWSARGLENARVNLERSLRYGDRIHGHAVSGHIDATGEVLELKDLGGSFELSVRAPDKLRPFIWPKGSWAVNGVSLTINEIAKDTVKMCLIPETIKRTNLGALKPGDRVNLEIDMLARGLIHFLESREKEEGTK